MLQELLGGDTQDESACEALVLNRLLVWDGGVWNDDAIGNGISACTTYLIPEVLPPSVFQEGFGEITSQCVSNFEFLSGWPMGDQWKLLHNCY